MNSFWEFRNSGDALLNSLVQEQMHMVSSNSPDIDCVDEGSGSNTFLFGRGSGQDIVTDHDSIGSRPEILTKSLMQRTSL